jgi:SAM-dependent methyltransferase
MRAYERLSQVYDLGWGDFATKYSGFVNRALCKQGIGQARILDIACGTGILAIALAKKGHWVQGIDLSPEMVAAARSKSVGVTNVSFDIQDIRKLEAPGLYDLVTCTFDALNYILRERDLKGVFSRVASALQDSGLFIFDSNTTHHYISREDGSLRRSLGGESFLQSWRYDPAKKEAATTFRFSDGQTEVHWQRPYDLEELRPLLIRAGFRVRQTWSSFDKREFTAKSDRLFCVAQKIA